MASNQEENREKPDSELSDDLLISHIKDGRNGDFEILLQRYERRVFSFILRMVGNREDAEELAQDCFVRAFRAIPDYQPRGRFCSWLLTIARNLTKNRLTKKYHDEKFVHQGELPENIKSETKPEIFTDEIQEWLFPLPEDYRIVMTLKYISDLSCSEIAEIESISEAAVKQRLHRAREMIRDRLENKDHPGK